MEELMGSLLDLAKQVDPEARETPGRIGFEANGSAFQFAPMENGDIQLMSRNYGWWQMLDVFNNDPESLHPQLTLQNLEPILDRFAGKASASQTLKPAPVAPPAPKTSGSK